MRCIGYARVSTVNQALGDSTNAQSEAINAWTLMHGHTLVDVVRDEAKSGTLGEIERAGLLAALNLLQAGDVDALVVHRLDRLARSLHVQEAVLAQVWEARGSAWEVVGNREVLRDDPSDPMRTFVRQVMGAAAQLERGMVVARLQGGRQRRLKQGGYVGGWTGYGVERVAGRLVPLPAEQLVLGRIGALRRSGRTYREIAMTLNAEGIPAKRGGPWSHTSVRAVLQRASGEGVRFPQ